MERIVAVTFARMAKGWLVLTTAVLAMMLAAAVPAFAQEQQVSATGVLQAGLPADVGANGTHSITDGASSTVYALESGTVDLDAYVGQQVTVYGALTPGEAPSGNPGFEGGGTLPSIDVTRVEPAEGPAPGSSPERTATFDFQLTVKGQPPAGAGFFGAVPAEGCISVPLSDPDADGVFTGSLDVPRFPPGPLPPEGAEPVSLPVRIVQADGGAGPCNPTAVIRDFGTVPADDGTFKARVNFKGGESTSPEEPTDECLAVSENPEECEGYVAPGDSNGGTGSNAGSGDSGTDSGSSDSGGSGSGDSDGSDSGNSGRSDSVGSGSGGSGSSGSGNNTESSGSPIETPSGVTGTISGLLPSTGGGVALWVLGLGILLIGGGLLVRKLAR